MLRSAGTEVRSTFSSPMQSPSQSRAVHNEQMSQVGGHRGSNEDYLYNLHISYLTLSSRLSNTSKVRNEDPSGFPEIHITQGSATEVLNRPANITIDVQILC